MEKIKLLKKLFDADKNGLKESMAPTTWYRIKNQNDPEAADVYIYDEISWLGVDSAGFVRDLMSIRSKVIRVHLNTPGGYVFDGVAIYNALRNHSAKIETYIEGLAASIGSIIAMAGDKIYIAENAFLMIHDPFIVAVGDAEELRKTADLLSKIKESLLDTYVKRTGQDRATVEKWMSDETWFNAKESVEYGFADEITGNAPVENHYDLSVFNNVPEVLLCQAKHEQAKEKQKSNYDVMKMRFRLTARSEAEACQRG